MPAMSHTLLFAVRSTRNMLNEVANYGILTAEPKVQETFQIRRPADSLVKLTHIPRGREVRSSRILKNKPS
jgi:hypothetical protein